MPTIDVNGETLAYIRAGSGQPLVLVHSLGTAGWLWDEQIREWATRFDVIAFDARGHGKSTNNGGVTLSDIARDLHEALSELNLLPAHLVGISMGGIILAHLADAHPEAVRSLVIADSFASLGAAGATRADSLSAQISASTMKDYGILYADETILPATPRVHHKMLADSIGAMKMDDYLQTVRSIFTSDVRAQLGAIKAPALVVCGDKDNRTPPAKSEEIASIVPGARLALIPDAAHLANLDNPDAFNRIVGAFLEEQIQ